MKISAERDHKLVSGWLLLGAFMVLIQIMLGGITRLTGSGLSITRWEIVTGAIPPLNAHQWSEAFDLYKQTPQYQKINEGISLSHFKFIFFWEYVHRLWARTMGLVFIFPFIFFLIRGSLSRKLIRRLMMVVFLAALAALFGWIMVASGLVMRPWVNAYKLTIHLGLGIALFVYLFFTWLSYRGYQRVIVKKEWNKSILVLIVLAIIQICLGGFVSGMKAALSYPTWPLMHGELIPEVIRDGDNWTVANFLFYDKTGFMSALVQVVHRNLGYLIAILVIVFSIKWWRTAPVNWKWISVALVGIIVVQAGLGIMTLLKSIGSIPVMYGALHQVVGIIFLTFLIYWYQSTKLKYNNNHSYISD